MAVLNTQFPTLTDWAKMTKDGSIMQITNVLAQTNSMLEDGVYFPGNLSTGHKVAVTTALPDSYFKKVNGKVPVSKGDTEQVMEQASILQNWSNIDEDVAELSGEKPTRAQAGRLALESMNQKQQATKLYGNENNAEEYVGFIPRYDDLNAGNKENILNCGGAGSDNTSMLLCGWGAGKVYNIFPKGSKAGIKHVNHGKSILDTVNSVTGLEERQVVFQDQWVWKEGLVVEDWRYLVRLGGIDISDLKSRTGTQSETAETNLIDQMSTAIDHFPMIGGCKPVFYCNRTVMSYLRRMAKHSASDVLSFEKGFNQFGPDIFTMTFQGIPIRIVDQFINTEAALS